MYIRVNGKIYGPYTEPEMQKIKAEGHLLLTSEVSYDQQKWIYASQVPNLFGDSVSSNPYASPQTLSQNNDMIDTADVNIGFWDAYKRCWKNKAKANGRSRRKEFWAWSLFNSIILIILYIFIFGGTSIIQSGFREVGAVITTIFCLALIIFLVAAIVPGIYLLIRRLHDINMSGWMVLLCFLPYVGRADAYSMQQVDDF